MAPGICLDRFRAGCLVGVDPRPDAPGFPPECVGFVNTFGHPVPQAILADAAGRAFLEFLFRWVGTVLIGSNLLTVFIAVTAFRKGERWAWLVFWYWPLMFAAHFLMYTGGFKVSQVVWTLLTAGALLLTNPYVKRSSR